MLHVFAVLAAALLFGTTGTARALGPAEASTLSVGVARMVVGGTGLALLALTLAARHRRRTPDRPRPALSWRPLALMATTGVAISLYQPLFFLGTQTNGVAVSTVIALGSAPVLAGILEWAVSRRVPSLLWMGATALAAAGVVLLGFGGGSGTGGVDAVGLAAAVGAGACFAVIANAQRRLLDGGWDPFTVVGAMGVGSAVICAAAIPFVDLAWAATPSGLTMALWLGLATISLAYVLFTWGLQGLTAATAATLTLGEPLTATVLGVSALGETLSPLAVIGLAVLAAGLVTLAWGSRRPRDPRPFAVEA
ncbi:EamA/RhaT family transporter [Microbacterium oleivorans]|uniref:EamA family transporter n=1 Tax=Microbacterium oleivorans TaxID=273677 RepID=UPI0010A4FCD6|nr:EamA family transporter [Microbacterium oleivorans]THE06768.1 EamA/RhaT family transporter [Microbacterium oleivorans]